MKKQRNRSFYKVALLLVFGSTFTALSPAKGHSLSNTFRLDSVGTEIINGKRFVLHKISSKETYYQLGRIYNVSVNSIMSVNSKKSLRVGDVVKIPKNLPIEESTDAQSTGVSNTIKADTRFNTVQNKPQNQDIFTEYKVGKSETLYAISKRFDVSVESIKKVNNLRSDTLKEGQILKIPSSSLPEPPPPPPVITEISIAEILTIDDSDFKGNKYGIREKKEKGIGVWSANFGDGQSLALHPTAPVGTILKITNPMNKSVAFAKVVGKFMENEETQGAVVVISKSVATSMGLIDRRFQIELNYGLPLEQ